MHHGIGHIARRAASACAAGAYVIALALPAGADDHLPIIDIVPTSSFTTTSDAIDPRGGPKKPPPTNGDIELNGTIRLPVFKNFSLAYNRTSLGTFDSALSKISLGGRTLYPGGSRDTVQSYTANYRFGRFNLDGGFAHRYRRCCPAGSFEWHKGFLGLSYATPSLALLNHGFFVLDITGNSSKHYSSPNLLRSVPVGLSAPNGQFYTTQQAVTAIIPIDRKNGVRTAATFLWGALDYPINDIVPYYYDVVVFSGTKQVTPEFGITANFINVIQRSGQGRPFPPGLGIRTSAIDIFADFHIDLNRYFKRAAPPTTPGRPTQPGVPGGPGGPAQVGPTQGGTVSPPPSPTPSAAP